MKVPALVVILQPGYPCTVFYCKHTQGYTSQCACVRGRALTARRGAVHSGDPLRRAVFQTVTSAGGRVTMVDIRPEKHLEPVSLVLNVASRT